MSEFELNCCSIDFACKVYKIKEHYRQDVKCETFKIGRCPLCETLKVTYKREFKKQKDKPNKIGYGKLSGERAVNYYLAVIDNITEIKNTSIEKGSKSNTNWIHGINNKPYNFNGKKVSNITIAKFNKERTNYNKQVI